MLSVMTDTLPTAAPPPRGVVTFRLTDIAGSTRAWGGANRAVLTAGAAARGITPR
jgi:hypothetical protein